MTKILHVSGLGVLATCLATPVLACSSCGCNLTSDWLSLGLITRPGTTLSLQYDYVPQTQLRTNHSVLDRAAIELPPEREIEQRTDNHYVNATLDHVFNATWAVNLQVPYSVRPHRTIAEDTVEESASRSHGLADIRLTARYQGFGGSGITGVQFGLKLPTGPFRQTFRSGPVTGETVDRGLQPGTGTLDAIIGAYHFGHLAGAFDFVLQAQSQIPFNNRAQYLPGIAGTLSGGVHYTGWSRNGWARVTPQLQLNFRAAQKDHGEAADRPNSGGEQLYLAPGALVDFGNRVATYGFVQVPVYQRVNGYQLVPRYTLSIGLQLRL